MSRRTHHLDVDLLGGLRQLQGTGGRVGVWLPAASASRDDDVAALRDLLRREAEAYHELERDVAKRRQAHFTCLAQGDDEEHLHAWFLDAARAAGDDVAAHATALHGVKERLDDVVARCVVLPPGADGEALEVTVQLHDDGYALAQSPEAALLARREYLGLSDGEDWATPTSAERSRAG